MPIRVTCTCGEKLKAPDSLAGKSALCPACGQRLEIKVIEPVVVEADPILERDDSDDSLLADEAEWQSVVCPGCQSVFEVETSTERLTTACPDCGKPLSIPGAARDDRSRSSAKPKTDGRQTQSKAGPRFTTDAMTRQRERSRDRARLWNVWGATVLTFFLALFLHHDRLNPPDYLALLDSNGIKASAESDPLNRMRLFHFWLGVTQTTAVCTFVNLWVFKDARLRRTTGQLPLTLLGFYLWPVSLPMYWAKRPLLRGEVREGGTAWNFIRASAVAWTAFFALLVIEDWLIVEWAKAEAANLLASGGIRNEIFTEFVGGQLLTLSGAAVRLSSPAVIAVWPVLVLIAVAFGYLMRNPAIVERGPSGPASTGQYRN